MIRTEQAHLSVAAKSHPGMTGKNNEDRYAVSAFQVNAKDKTPVVLAVLADGIGGHRGGEVAAEMAVEIISEHIANSDGQHNPTRVLEEAIQSASQSIYTYAQKDSNLTGMGATCACAWVIGNRLYAATVGDSRIYLLRDQKIQQLSIDHTWIQEALERGLIQDGEVRGHPNAHVIRRFLGGPTPPEVDLRLRLHPEDDDLQAESNQGLQLHPGDRLLLCSDGLTDLVKDEEIQENLMNLDAEVAVQQLVDLSCERGGHDNITVITLGVPEREVQVLAAQDQEAKPAARRRLVWWAVGCGGLVGIVLLASWLYYSLGGQLPVIAGWNASPTPAVTLPSSLLTALPEEISTPTPTTVFQAVTPTSLPQVPGMDVGPTYTPWPTNTVAP